MNKITRIRDAHFLDMKQLAALRYADKLIIHFDRLREAAARHLRYLVAERARQLVGFGVLVFEWPESWPDTGDSTRLPQIMDLYVAETARSQGIGTQMIQAMEQAARKAGHTQIFTSVDPVNNSRAYTLYASLGYQPLKDEPYQDSNCLEEAQNASSEACEWILDMVKVLEQTQYLAGSGRIPC
jgi:GNAT superfamily N-acetyltransferase